MHRLLLVTLLATASLNAAASSETFVHTVRPGDTLIGVRDSLLRPGVSWQSLQRLNRVADPLRLRPGSRLQGPNDWLRERPVRAQLLQVHGQVAVQRGGQAQPVQAGDWLQEGDRLQSGPQGSALLAFVDGSRSRLRAGSELDLIALKEESQRGRTVLGLRSGALESKVPPATAGKALKSGPRFEVRTPVAQLGVRGTEFRSRAEAGATWLEVLEGQVQASRGKSRAQAVAAGLGWRSDSATASALPAAPLLAPFTAPVQRLPLVLQWPTAEGVQAWRLQVEDASGQVLLETLLDRPQWQGGQELPDGDLLLRLRARNQQGFEGPDTQLSLPLRARPEAPLLQSPAAEAAESSESVRFAWTRALDAARYHWQLAPSADFAQPSHDEAALSGTEWRVALPLGQHHWRVASVRENGQRGPWSDPQTLTRVAPPPPPAAPPPAQSQQDGSSLSLRWAGKPGERYEIQVSRQSDFTQPWYERSLDAPQVQLQPEQGGPHYVRIRTLAEDGRAGPWGGTQIFEWSSAQWWWWLTPLLLFAL